MVTIDKYKLYNQSKKGKARQKRYYLNHKKQIKKYLKEWKTINPNYDKLYIQNNRSIINKRRRKHHKLYPEIRRQSIRRRTARMNNIIHDFSTNEWLAKLKATNGVCPKCNRFIGIEHLELDHIWPISKAKQGQVYNINNVQPLCKSCNSRKKDKRS